MRQTGFRAICLMNDRPKRGESVRHIGGMTIQCMLTIGRVPSHCFDLQPEQRATGKNDHHAVGTLYLDKSFVDGGLDYMLAVPPTVRVWLPEGCAFANGDDDAVEGTKSGGEEDVKLFGFPHYDGGGGQNRCGEVEAEGRNVRGKREELKHETTVGNTQ